MCRDRKGAGATEKKLALHSNLALVPHRDFCGPPESRGEFDVGHKMESTMQTIQVVLDAKLLNAADTAAKREKLNRSSLIRKALENT